MKYAINAINFGDCGDARTLTDLALNNFLDFRR
jgi:hypothetical protein